MFPIVLASLGELILSVFLNFGTVGVSKAAFRFTDPLEERCGTGVFGTKPASLCPLSLLCTTPIRVSTYISKTSSPFPVLRGVANAPLLSTLRTCAFPLESRSSISCRSFLNALAVITSSLVCSDPIFML